MDLFITWLNQNVGLVTLVVGCFAIFLYLKQKSDTKKEAAMLIVQEVRFAESQIRNYRASQSYPFSSTILPTSTWSKNIHLFVKHLSESEIDLISTFYSQSAYIDILINKISDIASAQMILDPLPGQLVQLPMSLPQVPQNSSEPQSIQDVIIQQRAAQGTLAANKILGEVSERIEFVFNSPAIEKLARLSRKSWYLLWLF